VDGKNYARCLKAILIPNVIDSASYHNIQTDKAPTYKAKRDYMKAWLLERTIPFYDNMGKVQLHDIEW
jgi:hypothetical protein